MDRVAESQPLEVVVMFPKCSRDLYCTWLFYFILVNQKFWHGKNALNHCFCGCIQLSLVNKKHKGTVQYFNLPIYIVLLPGSYLGSNQFDPDTYHIFYKLRSHKIGIHVLPTLPLCLHLKEGRDLMSWSDKKTHKGSQKKTKGTRASIISNAKSMHATDPSPHLISRACWRCPLHAGGV
jgi:hypothetical protein